MSERKTEDFFPQLVSLLRTGFGDLRLVRRISLSKTKSQNQHAEPGWKERFHAE